jgi:hypothetical protein
MAMMAITTKSSIKVKAVFVFKVMQTNQNEPAGLPVRPPGWSESPAYPACVNRE